MYCSAPLHALYTASCSCVLVVDALSLIFLYNCTRANEQSHCEAKTNCLFCVGFVLQCVLGFALFRLIGLFTEMLCDSP